MRKVRGSIPRTSNFMALSFGININLFRLNCDKEVSGTFLPFPPWSWTTVGLVRPTSGRFYFWHPSRLWNKRKQSSFLLSNISSLIYRIARLTFYCKMSCLFSSIFNTNDALIWGKNLFQLKLYYESPPHVFKCQVSSSSNVWKRSELWTLSIMWLTSLR